MDMKETVYYAHRGANYHLPENTTYAIEKMISNGIKGIEFDVRLTKEGEVVLSHDNTFERTGGVAKKVNEMTLEEIQDINVAKYRKNIEEAVPPPILSEVLVLCKQHDTRCSIELKDDEDFSIIEKVNALIKEHDMESLAQVYSFNIEMIKEFSRKNPSFALHLNLDQDPMPFVALAKENRWGLNPRFDLVTKEFIEACKQNNIDVHVWTVNDREMKQLLECWGVKTIISDDLHCEA